MTQHRAQAYLDERPIGSSIEVFVNSVDPADTALFTDAKNDWWVPIMFVALTTAVAAECSANRLWALPA